MAKTNSRTAETTMPIFGYVLTLLVLHIIDIQWRLSSPIITFPHPMWLIYTITALIGGFFLLPKEQGKDFKTVFQQILWAQFATFWPEIFKLIATKTQFPVYLTTLILVFAPFWLLNQAFKGTKWTKRIGSTYLLGWIVIWLLILFPALTLEKVTTTAQELMPGYAINVLKDKIIDGYENIAENIAKLSPWRTLEEIDPIASKVDETSQERIGVYITKVKPQLPSYYEGQDVTIQGSIYAKVLDTKLKIKAECYDPENKENIATVYPEEEYEVDEEDERTTECTFKNVKREFYKANMKTTVEEMKTYAYVKNYFMNEDTYLALKSKKSDPLDAYNIKDKTPITERSAGPLKAGMELSQKPLMIVRNKDEKFSLIMSFENAWRGKIKEFTDLIFMLPKGMELSELTFAQVKGKEDQDYKKITCEEINDEAIRESCNDERENVYQLTKEGLIGMPRDIKNEVYAISFRINVKKTNWPIVMQNQKFAAKNFKALFEYTYEQESTTNIQVRSEKKTEADS